MRPNPRLLSVLLSLALGACASAGWHTYARSPEPAAKPTQLAAAPTSEPIICRTDVSTGSLLPHRECHTQHEWDEISLGQIDRLNQNATRSPAAMGATTNGMTGH